MTDTSIGALQQRARGCLLGLAVGDALGTTLEFQMPGSFDPIDDMVGGGPFRLKPGEWTDDTSMALCLAESLIECGFDPIDQLQRYVRWRDHGYMSVTGRCFDIGRTVNSALEAFVDLGVPEPPTHANSAGNGSIMRLAPVAIWDSRGHAGTLVEHAAQSSATTHGATEAVDGCRYLALLLAGLIRGEDKYSLLSADYWTRSVPDATPLAPGIASIAAGSFAMRMPPEIRGSGYVVHSLEAALWAFARTNTFRDGALLAVNLGEDADTTGAVYGQLAGACYGVSGIPDTWLKRLAWTDRIEMLAHRLLNAASRAE